MPNPCRAYPEPFRPLVLAVFPQQLHTLRAYLDAPPGAFCFGRGEYSALARDVLHVPLNGQCTRVQIHVTPAQPANLAPPGTGEQCKLCDNAELRRCIL